MLLFDRIQRMHDEAISAPDHECLFGYASGQRGYFTTAQAGACGFARDGLTYHVGTGRFIRIRPGLYRLRDYPSSPGEEVMAAWLAAGPDLAVVSHESALDLLDLSDVIPSAIHLTIPRAKRYRRQPIPGVVLHTSTRPVPAHEVMNRDGVRLTTAARSILDAAEVGTGEEQIAMAIAQAIDRGQTTAELLRNGANDRSSRVRGLIERALSEIGR
jgi:predicted transcriptional regulator of viral defense system